jgi:glycerophosphoryl diester phosphodiesterase
MLTISHRGYCADHPENTLEAFRAAIALGVDGIETDVRLSADRLPILCHDRVAPNGKEVSLLTRNELADILGHAVPTLDEALDLDVWSGLWNIEIKTPYAAEVAMPLLDDYADSREILVTSFWHDLVRNVALGGKHRCGILVASYPSDSQSLVAILERLPSVESIVWDYEIFDRSLVKVASERNITTFVYGVKSKSEHEDCCSMGLEGVITDHPKYILSMGEVANETKYGGVQKR